MSGRPLRALLVEDSPDDAALLVRELERGGYEVTAARVDTADGLRGALRDAEWDILLADYSMPHFRGTDALSMARSAGYDLPFIFVSGTIGEDVAVEAMKGGANDYVIKGNLKRLVPAVARELSDAAVRRERKRIEEERRRVQEALRVSQERHRLLFEHIADTILVFDQSGILRFASASVREMLGLEPEALTSRPFLDLIDPGDAEWVREACDRVIATPAALETLEVRVRHQDESPRIIDCVMRNLLTHPDIGGCVVTCRDITERKRLETEFLQAQKLESVGQLAGGIAHDFNNVLTAILGHAEILLMDPRVAPEQRADVQEIKRAADRAAALTRQLLAISRRQVLDLRLLDLTEIISDLVQMLRRVLGAGVEIETVLAPDLGTVRADASQMEQVLLNLAINARDAMPTGGQLTIRTANVELDATFRVLQPPVVPGPYVRLTVSDTGEGMDAGTQARIFEPFFTTKAAGKGTGLGLAMVFGIVKQSGGYITVESEVGRGTAFHIHLRRVNEPADLPLVFPDLGAPPRGIETVLVVEDDAAVRDLVARTLRGLGYTVLVATRSEEALPWMTERAHPVHLLLADTMLPGMGGKELADRAIAVLPGLPVLFMSGYAAPMLTRNGILAPGVQLLVKPFSPAALAWRVREILDAHGE